MQNSNKKSTPMSYEQIALYNWQLHFLPLTGIIKKKKRITCGSKCLSTNNKITP